MNREESMAGLERTIRTLPGQYFRKKIKVETLIGKKRKLDAIIESAFLSERLIKRFKPVLDDKSKSILPLTKPVRKRDRSHLAILKNIIREQENYVGKPRNDGDVDTSKSQNLNKWKLLNENEVQTNAMFAHTFVVISDSIETSYKFKLGEGELKQKWRRNSVLSC